MARNLHIYAYRQIPLLRLSFRINKERGLIMKINEFNELPKKLADGVLTQKEVLNQLCSFVSHNLPLFCLQKYDEDTRQEIMLGIVEKGLHIISVYNPQIGDFFTFFYCHVCSIINTLAKKNTYSYLQDRLNMVEGINTVNEKTVKYHKIDLQNFNVSRAPLNRQKLSPEDLQKALKELQLNASDKKIIILALKSSYYLTDEQIERLCSIYKIKPEYFYNMIQYCKESIQKKSERRAKTQERRNFAYYHHRRYKTLLEDMLKEPENEQNVILSSKFERLEKKHARNWLNLNKSFEEGHLYLRPTNKTVANLLGICERQVAYYIKCAKKESSREDYIEEDDDDSPEGKD